MIYKTSSFNYWFFDNDELAIVNLKEGLSSFHIVTGEDIPLISDYLSLETCEISKPTSTEQFLIDGGFLIPADKDEQLETEIHQLDYIYDNKLHLVVHVTKDCNFRCKYCFIDFKHQKMEPCIQDGVVDYIRKNIAQYSGVYISWFGGEPLMGMDVIENISKKVIEICKRAKKPYVAGITTNGYLLTPENIKKLVSLKVYSYCITLDGLKESHDNQRVLVNGKTTFDRIVSNLRYIKNEIKFKYLCVCIRTNFTSTTLENIDEYLDFFNSEFGDDNRFVPLFKLASDWGGERINELRSKLLDSNAIKLIYDSVLKQSTPMYINNITELNFGGMTCNAVRRNKYTVSTDGMIAKCDTVCDETAIGYIDSKGWHFDRAKEAQWLLSYKIRNNECAVCRFRYMCFQGSCPKKKLTGTCKSSCPKPVFIEHLLLMYKKI